MAAVAFDGRARLISEIVQGALAATPGGCVLIGPPLVGKSRLLDALAAAAGPLLGPAFAAERPTAFAEPGRVRVLQIAGRQLDSPTELNDALYTQLAAPATAAPLERTARPAALARQLAARGVRTVLLLDDFDQIAASLTPADVAELAAMARCAALIVASDQPLYDLDDGPALAPLLPALTPRFMGLLEPDAARAWLAACTDPCPGLRPALDTLLELTGAHPYLLRRMGDVLQEAAQMLPGQPLDAAHLPLLRLRLAEHSRALFALLWQRLQTPGPRVQAATVRALVQRLVAAPVAPADLSPAEASALNWLLNQAMLTYRSAGSADARPGFALCSPLLAEFLAEQLARTPALPPEVFAPAAPQPTASAASASAHRLPPAFDVQGAAALTRTEVALLGYLRQRAHQVVAPEQLLRDVWRRPDATARRVQEAIRRLRLQLAQADPPIGVIENDRGRGYRFVPHPVE